MDAIYVLILLYLLFLIPEQIGWGLIFKKMGLSFNDGIIPFYNKIKLINKYKLPQFNIAIVFIPLLNIYTNYIIYKKICKQYHKEKLYVVELTFFPFIYNFFLAFEIKKTQTRNEYLEDQKSLYETKEEKKVIPQDEYIWHPKKENIYTGVYKATRNKLNTKIILEENKKEKKDTEIINNKKEKKLKIETKECPNCNSKLDINEEICHICGKKI